MKIATVERALFTGAAPHSRLGTHCVVVGVPVLGIHRHEVATIDKPADVVCGPFDSVDVEIFARGYQRRCFRWWSG